MTDCGGEYASHAWEWRGTGLVCAHCGLVDLAGRRVVERVLTGLAAEGYQVVRTSAGEG